MTTTASIFIATSLDGFISRLDGSIDWLTSANTLVPPGEDCGYGEFIKTVDVLVMGRKTFEQVLTFDPWPYQDLEVVVLSSRALNLPESLKRTVSTTTEAPAILVARLAATGATHLYIDGGKTIQSFLSAGLVSQITITVIPVLLGTGRPLFGPIASDCKLQLTSSKAYDFGFVQNTYRVLANT